MGIEHTKSKWVMKIETIQWLTRNYGQEERDYHDFLEKRACILYYKKENDTR